MIRLFCLFFLSFILISCSPQRFVKQNDAFLFRDFDVSLTTLQNALEKELKSSDIDFKVISKTDDLIVIEGDTENTNIRMSNEKWGGLRQPDIFTFKLIDIDGNESKLQITSRPKVSQSAIPGLQLLGSENSSELMRSIMDNVRFRVKKLSKNQNDKARPKPKTRPSSTRPTVTSQYTTSKRSQKKLVNIDIKSLKNSGRYYALVIGNNKYKFVTPLDTAEHDAKEVSNLLRKAFGFKTTLLLNATRSQILKELAHFRTQLTKNDNLLIYYAGHGWLDEDVDEGYWLPIDAEKDNPSNWLSNSDITTMLRAIQSNHIIIIADSCYSGKLTRGLEGEGMGIKSNKYLQRILQKSSRTVLSSGGLEPVADAGGKNNHSIFTGALLSALNNIDKTILGTELFLKVRHSVVLNAIQTPEYADLRNAGHDGGDFLFIKK